MINFIITASKPRRALVCLLVVEGAPGIDPHIFFDDDSAYYIGNHAPENQTFQR